MQPVLLKLEPRKRDARFGLIRNVEYSYKLHEGVRLAGEIPANAEFRISDDYPNGRELGDFLSVLGHQLVVSARARAFLARYEPKQDLEFLPVRAVDHRGDELAGPFSLINLLNNVDCVDRGATSFRLSKLDPTRMVEVDNLTLDVGKIPVGKELFRVAGLPAAIVASRALIEAMKREGLTGVDMDEIEDFMG